MVLVKSRIMTQKSKTESAKMNGNFLSWKRFWTDEIAIFSLLSSALNLVY